MVLKDPHLAAFFEKDEDASSYVRIRERNSVLPDFYDYVIGEKSSGKLIGEINAAVIDAHTADIGYVLASPFHGMGYGTEAVTAFMAMLEKDGYTEIYGACEKDNIASARIMEHAGMKRCLFVPISIRKREHVSGLIYYCRR